jgi:hypothetical protein
MYDPRKSVQIVCNLCCMNLVILSFNAVGFLSNDPIYIYIYIYIYITVQMECTVLYLHNRHRPVLPKLGPVGSVLQAPPGFRPTENCKSV